MNELQDPKLYVSTILYVHQRYSKLVGEAFVNEPGFLQSLDKVQIENRQYSFLFSAIHCQTCKFSNTQVPALTK